MEVRKRTEITVETNEVLMVRRARVYRAWCPECGREVEMVSLFDARTIAGLTMGAARPSRWHVCPDLGAPLVCMESILKS